MTASQLAPFPADFLWGTATAAHQVEGGNDNNDWWDWEQAPGRIKDGARSGLACDHFRRFRDDFRLLADLGQNAHRLSLEWSRIEPRPGEFDADALAHYRQVLETMRRLGLEPVVTLHHFTNPRWLAQQGGWTRAETVDRFARYVERVIREYRDLVVWWITINEPNVYAFKGFLDGEWPPGRRGNLWLALRVLRHMLLAHARAYHLIHHLAPDARVSLAHHLRLFDPDNSARRVDAWAAGARNALFNRTTLEALAHGRLRWPVGRGEVVPALAGTVDYVALNYYSREHVAFYPLAPHMLFGREAWRDLPRSAFGWEIYPEGLYRALRLMSEMGPVLVTENGVADWNDELRPSFVVEHVRQVARALEEGVSVLGYLHWSSMDNFEWAAGFSMRFGLIHVDFETQRRRIKPSGELYARICRARGRAPEISPTSERPHGGTDAPVPGADYQEPGRAQ